MLHSLNILKLTDCNRYFLLAGAQAFRNMSKRWSCGSLGEGFTQVMEEALGADEAAIQEQIQDYSNDSKVFKVHL